MKQFIFHSNPMGKEQVRVTVAAVIEDDYSKATFGVARCSKKDMFIRKVGKTKAIGRANSHNPYLVVNDVDKQAVAKWFTKTAAEIANDIANDPKLLALNY